jgi:hypothetical protein
MQMTLLGREAELSGFSRLVFGVLVLTASSLIEANAATYDLIAYSRIAERLLVVLAGILSLWMGFRLFQIASAITPTVAGQTPQAAPDGPLRAGGGIEGNIGDFVRVKLQDAGPGHFFALFGSGLLAYVMFSQLQITLPVTEPAKVETQQDQHLTARESNSVVNVKFAIPGLTPEESAAKIMIVVRAIRTIQDTKLTGDISKEGKDREAVALANLVQSTRYLVVVGFGEGAYTTYERLLILAPEDRAKTSEKDQKIFKTIYSALNEGI